MFKRLTVHNWRQFRDIDLVFHDRLTVLTGANGAGKTSLLHLLIKHWGWSLNYVSTPRFTKKGIKRYWHGFWASDIEHDYEDEWDRGEVQKVDRRSIGTLEYSNGNLAELFVPEQVNVVFSVDIQPMERVDGIYVPSHRPLYLHQPVDQIPTKLDAREQIFETYLSELRNRFSVNARVQSPSHRLKQALVSLATFGYGNEAVIKDEEAIQTFEGFQEILRIILPPKLGFNRIIIKVPDVILDTESGEFSFDAVSGGVAALIDIAWQVFMYSLLRERFVVVIDEPESHLHPELQQRIMPNLLEAFPQAQFIVASHNPFVVSSIPDSNVYVLDYDESKRVNSTLLDLVNKAGTSNDILRDVLGIDTTSPLWVEDKLKEIIERYSNTELSQETFSQLRVELEDLGLGKYIPETIAEVAEKSADD